MRRVVYWRQHGEVRHLVNEPYAGEQRVVGSIYPLADGRWGWLLFASPEASLDAAVIGEVGGTEGTRVRARVALWDASRRLRWYVLSWRRKS